MKKIIVLVLVLMIILGTALAEETAQKEDATSENVNQKVSAFFGMNTIAYDDILNWNKMVATKFPLMPIRREQNKDHETSHNESTNKTTKKEPSIWDFARNRQEGEEGR